MQTKMVSVALLIFGLLFGVAVSDPLEREPRMLISGRPNIDFGSCPSTEVVQDFDKDAVSFKFISLHSVCIAICLHCSFIKMTPKCSV